MPSSGIFLHDPDSGDTSWTALVDQVTGPEATFSSIVKPTSLTQAFAAILQAFVYERPVTLLDGDFSRDEVDALVGGEPVNHPIPLPPAAFPSPADPAALIDRVFRSANGRLTLFTSGTTGRPKRVTHGIDSLARAVKRSPNHRDSVWGFAFNPTHMAGVQVFLQACANGNSLVNLFGYPRETILGAIEKYRVTHISATPTFYRLLLPADRRLESVRRLTFGGERFDPSLRDRLQELFPHARLLNVYASTEAGSLFAADGDVFTLDDRYADDVRVENRQLLIAGRLLGHFDHPDDWFPTGDEVEVLQTAPLRFRFLQRTGDRVNVGGYKVNPHEVEDALRQHPAMRDARVFAKSNAVLGHILIAEVVPLDPGQSVPEPEIRRFLESRLQPHKIPRMIQSVPRITQSRTGKAQR